MGALVGRGSSHLFLVRLWAHVRSDGRVEWRGRIQRVADDARHPFTDLTGLVEVLSLLLTKSESKRS